MTKNRDMEIGTTLFLIYRNVTEGISGSNDYRLVSSPKLRLPKTKKIQINCQLLISLKHPYYGFSDKENTTQE